MLKISPIFRGKPNNYAKIDNYISRSAQPAKDDFSWLKQEGVTDIINFRTMVVSGQDFDEKNVVENLNMRYHNIPSITSEPEEENISRFLNIVDNVKNNNGKVHIHCKAGADRTGMYAFIYKALTGIGSLLENEKEWISFGHNTKRYPNLRQWAKEFVIKF